MSTSMCVFVCVLMCEHLHACMCLCVYVCVCVCLCFCTFIVPAYVYARALGWLITENILQNTANTYVITLKKKLFLNNNIISIIKEVG